MKKPSPMKMKKNVDSMDMYAKKRNKQLSKQPESIPMHIMRAEIMHDPESDMHTLSRAAEIRMNRDRHKAAKKIASQKMRHLSKIAEE